MVVSRVKVKKTRAPKYLAEVRGESCLVCGSPPPVHAHHLRHSERRGFGQKVGDNWVVPLCWECHADCHTRGDERDWWANELCEDPIEWATRNYKEWEGGKEEEH